ncbi:class II fructose-bisphosphate aldolase [bacterium]|nr:class II fructose-bisphosphate aldolase [bacterium]
MEVCLEAMVLTSTQKLYEKIAKGEFKGFTVPAFNIRTLTFDVARALFRAAKKEEAGAFILELAQSEINYTDQSPKEYVKNVTEAALKEKFEGPLFFQGDHFKANSKNLKNLIKESIKAGFFNIDIDGSVFDNLKENAKKTASLTFFIRNLQPKSIEITIGGEISKIGGKNTTSEEFKEFAKTYQSEISKYKGVKGIIKVAVQTGTSHGGIVLPSGHLKQIEADFDTLTELSREAKKYGMAGAVQHGASTLPEKYFERFPKTGCCEIHLATQFQNIIYDSDYFPKDLREKIYSWLKEKFWKKKKPSDSEEQFIYKFRKRALGAFKKDIWSIPQKNIDKICEELEEKFRFFFQKLNVSGTKYLIEKIYL